MTLGCNTPEPSRPEITEQEVLEMSAIPSPKIGKFNILKNTAAFANKKERTITGKLKRT